ncbi:MAG: DUF3800 domain-containing protein [Maribacter dokdonensis]|uniref:DUF3800 domain-containing protein n=1 Tax=Maribacter dokdonensis TaxID=320912 RepID=UPI00329820E8
MAYKSLYKLYIDDSGTRNPDRNSSLTSVGDWFSLGGILVRDEDHDKARSLHESFCEKYNITYPLHSVKIRHRTDNFSWLAQLEQHKLREFFADFDRLMIEFPAISIACVIDRPGYNNRYYEKYGRQRWQLCKTAFSIVVERAAKFAEKSDRRMRVYVEKTDKKSDRKIVEYFKEMRGSGLPFSDATSEKYEPMNASNLKETLIELRFRDKNCLFTQMADVYLYPLCRNPYDSLYRPFNLLKENGKLIESHLEDSEIGKMGTKHSCFED